MNGWDQRRQQSCKLIFFASFAFVLAHIFVHKATEGQPSNADHHLLKQWLIGAAAGLPVIAAGLRTYRASREFERNALRHRATLDSLEALERQLRETKDLAGKFRLLGFCETGAGSGLPRIYASFVRSRVVRIGLSQKLQRGVVKFGRFGKIVGKSALATPNHCASVAPY